MSNKKKHEWVPVHSTRAQNMGKLLSERDWCYFIPEQHGEDGFIPACVIENVQGYRMMSGNGEGASPWYWGKTLEEAYAVCEKVNAEHGISKMRAQEIVLSTMGDFGTIRKRPCPSCGSVTHPPGCCAKDGHGG